MVWASIGASALWAQRFNFKFYGEEEGLENLAVQVLLQDRAGFLWVGTQNGLFRYDGSRFKGFGKQDGLTGARIESIHEAVDGTLWVGTRTGIARYLSGRFQAVPINVAQGIASREGIASDASGRLYLATERGLVVGSRAENQFKFTRIEKSGQVDGEGASSVYVDGEGTVWYGCANSLCRLENGEGREVGATLGLPRDHWDAILGDLDGNLWVRSDTSLYFRANGTPRFEARKGLPESSNTNPTLAFDPSGRLLVPTYRGLARQNGDGWQLIDAQQGLTSNDISAVMQDREGSMWIGLLGSGVARWLGYNEWTGWGEREGLSRESIWSITRDANGRLWVGTQFGLNYAETQKDGRLIWRSQRVAGIDMIRTLAAAPDGTLWIGGTPGGLHQLDPRTGEQRTFGRAEGLSSDNVRHLMVDRQDRVWASTRDGLFRGLAENHRFEQSFPAGTQPGEMFHMTMVDRQGQVWAAGARGLARLRDGQWTRFTKRDGLTSDVVAHVAEDPDGAIWIGYYDAFGLTRLTFPNGALKLDHFTVDNGLRSDKSIFLGVDTRGRLWAGSDHGVDVYDHARWRHYGRADGMIWDDCNSNAFLAEAGGAMWIGTSRGLSRFLTQAAGAPNVPPPVVFTSVKLGDEDFDAKSSDIPYARNSLAVRFAALTFVRESGVVFRYRLAGVQGAWLETTERELNYPKLPPGAYTLEVVARNAQGAWSAEPARISFTILPPWYLTWWFRVAAAVLALVLIGLLWQRRTRRLKTERNRLEAAVARRTQELSLEKQRVIDEKARTEEQKVEIERLLEAAQQASRSKSEFLANMSHEIRTPMNGVLGMTDLVLGTALTAEQREYVETARLSAHSLLTLLNDVLDFSKIEAGRLDLSPMAFSLRQCVDETIRMFRITANEKKLQLEGRIRDHVPDRVVGDPDRLRQVLLNLIGNALKFTEKGGVTVRIEVASAMEASVTLQFSVTDTGIGIPPEKQQIIFEAFRQADGSTTRKYGGSGLGLAICSRLVELMNGAIRVESEPGRGSTFHFTALFGLARQMEEGGPTDGTSLQNMVAAVGTVEATGTPGRCLNILLAEDNVINQRVATRLLERRGHRVAIAASGRAALDAAASEHFDVILMDVQMPDLDGIEATRLLREREKTDGTYTPIVALTAYTMKGDRERCLAAGMDTYVNKPIEAVKFIQVVESAASAIR